MYPNFARPPCSGGGNLPRLQPKQYLSLNTGCSSGKISVTDPATTLSLTNTLSKVIQSCQTEDQQPQTQLPESSYAAVHIKWAITILRTLVLKYLVNSPVFGI